MPRLLLAATACLAAGILPAATAHAQLAGSSGTRVHSGPYSQIGSAPIGRPDGDRRRGRNVVLYNGFGYSPDWGYYNNRSFAPDSFNDWWHDRPDRSMPRWVGQNGNCERQYWSGGGWRC